MLKTRIIPCLQLIENSLVKTVKFDNPSYIGDPVNTVRIFNELEVDELCFLDIRATSQNLHTNFNILEEIANECFMPLSFGGGLKDFDTVKKIFAIGFEKVVINSSAIKQPSFISKIADYFGNQAVIASIDVKKNILGKYLVFANNGIEKTKLDPILWAKELEDLGAGELLVTSMDRDGTWNGFDLDITKKISDSVSIPVIANGGAGSVQHIGEVVKHGGASAVALGSMVVYQKKGMGVLVNFPDKKKLSDILKY